MCVHMYMCAHVCVHVCVRVLCAILLHVCAHRHRDLCAMGNFIPKDRLL
jgi:hypothetical protein